jgi:hypothetical protein
MPDITGIDNENVIPFVSAAATNESKEKTTKAKANDLKNLIALPPPPGESVGLDGWAKWVKLLTPEMQANNRIAAYVYRTHPAIMLQKVDPNADNYIDFIASDFELINENYFIDRFGGGKYKIVIADQGLQKKNFGGYFQVKVDIPVLVHEPKLDYRTLNMNDKNNKGFIAWAIAKGKIDENGNVMTPGITQQQNGNNDTVQLMKLVMDFMGKMTSEQETKVRRALGENDNSKGVTEILLERMKQDDPNKQLTALTSVMAAMKSMQPSGDSGLAAIMPLFMQMFQQQQESNNRQFQMMMELMKSNKGEGTGESRDSISQLKDLLEVAKEIRGTGHQTSGKSQVAEILDAASPILGPVFNMVASIIAAKSNAPTTVPIRPTGATTVTPVPNNTTTTPDKVSAQDYIAEQARLANQQSQTQPNGSQPMLPASEAQQIITQFGPIIINHLAGEGWEFAAWIAQGFGDATAAKAANHGATALLEAAKVVPEFWNTVQQTYGEEYLKNWLTSFCNYREEMKKMESDED